MKKIIASLTLLISIASFATVVNHFPEFAKNTNIETKNMLPSKIKFTK